ncbi:MAG: dihydroxyacetone kinase subunit DhaK [Litorilinea sp.]
MQKLINNPAEAATESLEGMQLAYPDLLRVHYHPHVVTRADAPVAGKVTIISGSGSGHEPLNVGYVGRGMLDAACPGAIFTSPTPDQYLAALRKVYGDAGALFVVKNFMGGVLNTEIAMELAAETGYDVASVLIHDDVALDDVNNRRGMGAAVFVEKVAGAAAEAGQDFEQVQRIARRAATGTRSMGVALSSCTLPSVGRPTFQLPRDFIEIGVGIHGEPGRTRAPLTQADDITTMLVEPIVAELSLRPGSQVVAMVSGLGGTPIQELYIVYRYLHQFLAARQIHVVRRLVGNYVTSLDMAGCIISLLALDDTLLSLWDAPVHTPALKW